MNESNSQTIAEAVFQRMGVPVENALATGTDFVDEKVSQAVESGFDVDERFSGLGQLLEKLTEPSTMFALGVLLDRSPQLAALVKLAEGRKVKFALWTVP